MADMDELQRGWATKDLREAHEEIEQLRANVATLVEQLGEAERLYRTTREGANQYTAQALHLQRLLIRIVKYAHEDGAVTPRSTRLARALAEAEQTLAGASQPVVEPRDETKPPPGWHWAGVDGRRVSRGATLAHPQHSYDVAEAWKLYDAEHGYAPHPSGTEGPPSHGQLVRESLGNPARCVYVGGEGWVSPRRVCELADGLRRGDSYPWRDVTDHGDLLATASPPDGTAPERALLHRFVDHETDPCQLDHHGYCQAHPGAQETGQECAVSEGRRLLATRPPDGMPGEPAKAKCAECGTRGGHVWSCSYAPPTDEDANVLPAAPPTVPGEPDAKCYCGKPATRWCGCCEGCARIWAYSEPLTPDQ